MGNLEAKEQTKLAHSLWGTMRASINNMVAGVDSGFNRKLKLTALVTGNARQQACFEPRLSHPVEMDVPAG